MIHMKFLLILFLLLCAFSVSHSLRCFSCNTEKLFCPTKIVTCPADQKPIKCVSLTKDDFKFKGCYSDLVKFSFFNYFSGMNENLDHRLNKPMNKLDSECYCNTDLCNGSWKFSKKIQIVSTVAGVVFVLFKLF